MLVEQAEGALLGLVALAGQVLQSLLAGHHLAAANDAAVFVLDQILLLQTTGRVLGGAVEHLGLRTNSNHLGHLILRTAFLKRGRLKVNRPDRMRWVKHDAPFRPNVFYCSSQYPTSTNPTYHNDNVST